MTIAIALSYFHPRTGPLVFYSYPRNFLDKDFSKQIANIMDQAFNEGFITSSFENLRSLSYYFEIHSDWARGNKEMLMVSTILDQHISPKIEQKISESCAEFSRRLQSKKEIFSAFYINDINKHEEDGELIINCGVLIKQWLTSLYWAILEEIREKTGEAKMAILLNEAHIFKTLRKLSKGPILLEWLHEWFSKKFLGMDFDEMINSLVDKQFISINQIGLVGKYILLLKEVNAVRISPDNLITYRDSHPELTDLLRPKVQEYIGEYEKKTDEELRKDSFTLFQIMANPMKYNILSELRNGLISIDKLPKLVPKKVLESLMENIEFLKKHDVIEELNYSSEKIIVLKTNMRITTAFPEWMRKSLPEGIPTQPDQKDITQKIGLLEKNIKEIKELIVGDFLKQIRLRERDLEIRDRELKLKEQQLTETEEPIIILIISEGGVLSFSYPFKKELKFEDEMLGNFLSAFNSFSDELFSEGLDRAKFGAYSVLMESVSNFTICYLFKGQIYLAKQKLSHFTEQIQKDASILQTLNKFHETSQVVELTDIPFLEILITEIFVKKKASQMANLVNEEKRNNISE